MKKILALLFVIFVLSACSAPDVLSDLMNQGEESSDNLVNRDNVENGYWLGQSGNLTENEDMFTTDYIDYDPDKTYIMNNTAYVGYFDGEDFIRTILHDKGRPNVVVETVDNANNIRVSTQETKLSSFEITTEE